MVPDDFLCFSAGKVFKGMVEQGDAELRIPDDNGSICVVNQVGEVLACLPQCLFHLDLCGYIERNFPGPDDLPLRIPQRDMDHIINCLPLNRVIKCDAVSY